MLRVIIMNNIKDGCKDNYIKIANDLVTFSLKEKGCIFCKLYNDTERNNNYYIIEDWIDVKSADMHFSSKNYDNYVSLISKNLTNPIEISKFQKSI